MDVMTIFTELRNASNYLQNETAFLLENTPALLQNAAVITKRVDYYKTGQYR